MLVKTKKRNIKRNKEEPIAYGDEGKPIFAFNTKKEPVCNSLLRKKPGRRCVSTAVMGNGRCRIHGGTSPPAGPLHPTYKHGDFSQFVPQAIRPIFKQFFDNPDYLSLRSAIAMSDTRLSDLYAKADEALDKSSARLLHLTARKLKTALEGENPLEELGNLRSLAYQVIAIADKDQNARAIQAEMKDEEKHQTFLKDVERKRLVEATKQVSAEDVLAAMAKLVYAIQARVTDHETQLALSLDIDRIMLEAALPWGTLRKSASQKRGIPETTVEEEFPDYALDEELP